MEKRRRKTKRGRAVEQIDREGKVVCRFVSTSEAARRCFMSVTAVRMRCVGVVKKQHGQNGYTFRFAKDAKAALPVVFEDIEA